MKKFLIITLAAVVLLLCAAAAGWLWLTSTESGARWLLERAGGVAPSLAWDDMAGDLRGGIVLRGLQIDEAGVQANLDRLELAVRVHLPPSPRVDVHWLRASGGEVHLAASDEEKPDDEPPLVLPDLTSPIDVRVRELTLSDFRVHPAAADAPVVIERVHLVARAGERLEIETLEVELPELAASLSGDWGLSEPFAGRLELDADYSIPDGPAQALNAVVEGDLSELTVDLEASGPADLDGRLVVREPLNQIDAELALAGRLGDWPDLDLAVEDFELDAQGGPQDWRLDVDGRAVGQDLPDNRWRFELAGDAEQIELRAGRIEAFDGQVALTGSVDLSAGPRARLRMDAEALDLSPLSPEWPDAARLSGGFDLDASPDRITLEDLQFAAPPTSLALQGSGHWSPESDALAADLQWSELDWPPLAAAEDRLFQSRSGTLRLSGRLSDWQMELDAILQLLDQPELQVEASARGDKGAADIERLVADAGSAGLIETSGRVQFEPSLGGNLDIALRGLDSGRFARAWPGRIDADLGLQGQSLDSIALNLRRLDGELRNQPLSGQGQISLREDTPQAGDLRLRLGDNSLQLTSDDGRDWQLVLDATALRQLMPELSGGLALDGQFDVSSGTGRMTGTLSEAGWGDIALESAEFKTDLSWLGDRPAAQLNLQLSELDLNPWERIEQLELNLDGDCQGHEAELNLIGERGSLDLGLSGRLNSCTLSEVSAWAGSLDDLSLGNTIAGDWTLAEAMALNVAAGSVRADRGCLIEAAEGEGRICLRSLELAERGRVAIGIEQVPMDLLLVPLDPVFNLTTPLSGELQAGWSSTEGLDRLAGELRLGEGVIQPMGTDTSLLDIDSVRLNLDPEPEFLRVSLEAALEGDSRFNGQAQLVDLNDLSSATVDAEARLSLPDIGVFNRLVTDLDQVGGRLDGRIRLSGALLGPSLDGHLELSEGLVVNAPLGLRIEDIGLRLEATETSADLSGTLRSGDGVATVSGDLDLVEGQWQLDSTLSGDNFVFADVDWLRLRASPDIRLQRSGDGRTRIDGDIHIDRLRAGVPPGTAERVTTSDDVRVRGESDEEPEAPEIARQLEGRLGLELGDDARLAAAGM
ncbi:MAG: translocation/assembly module TamB domain-containing protein, partial [Wenzhouxiangella sp.]